MALSSRRLLPPRPERSVPGTLAAFSFVQVVGANPEVELLSSQGKGSHRLEKGEIEQKNSNRLSLCPGTYMHAFTWMYDVCVCTYIHVEARGQPWILSLAVHYLVGASLHRPRSHLLIIGWMDGWTCVHVRVYVYHGARVEVKWTFRGQLSPLSMCVPVP